MGEPGTVLDPPITSVQDDRFRQYVRDLANLMDLHDWELRISDDPADQADAETSTMARVTCTYGQKVAVLAFCKEFFGGSAETIRRVVVHELVHVHLDCIDTAVNVARSALSRGEWDMLHEGCHDAIEWATDAVARVIERGLPLITEAVG